MADKPPPGLGAIFLCFAAIGVQSFGGGLSAWMRREIVERRSWLEDGQFLGGIALSQIAPGPNAVNLSVFIGTTLRGAPGAAAALAGIMGLPIVIVLIAGWLYFRLGATGRLAAALAGMGAAAVGLILATGWRLQRRNVEDLPRIAVMIATAAAVGVLGWPLLPVLAVALPVSLLVGRRRS